MYSAEFHPQFRKDIKKIEKSLQQEIRYNYIEKILNDPSAGDKLSGEFSELYSFHFKTNKTAYRLIYTVNNNEEIVFFIMAGTRENIYKILKRRLS